MEIPDKIPALKGLWAKENKGIKKRKKNFLYIKFNAVANSVANILLVVDLKQREKSRRYRMETGILLINDCPLWRFFYVIIPLPPLEHQHRPFLYKFLNFQYQLL